MSTALVPQQASVPAIQEESLLSVIARVASDPRGINVEAMERLLAMKERIDGQERQKAYDESLARIQERMPRIGKHGRITVPGKDGRQGHSTPYALLEDIDVAVRPLMAAEGFAISFDTDTANGKIKVSGTLKHRAGHSETKSIEMPADQSGSKNAVQAVGSTVSYGRRHLIKMFFNVIETNEDDDGNGGSDVISQEDADTIRDLIASTGSDTVKFLKFMGVPTIAAILQRDSKKAFNALNQKARK